MQAENSELTQLAAQGITVLASSGDLGAYGNTGSNQFPATLNVNDPSSQPLVTSVGGTSLTTGPQQSYVGETVWNDLASSEGATGGGVSFFWQLPLWQQEYADTSYNGGSTTHRNLSNVSAVGDPQTGVAVYSQINGGWVEVGGTSVFRLRFGQAISPFWIRD